MIILKCPCGKDIKVFPSQKDRKKYCCKVCFYKYHPRPSGLKYNIVSENKGWFKKGNKTWNAGMSAPQLDKSTGYMIIRHNGNRVKYHRYVMEKHLGRELLDTEVVHHKDNNKLNNDISNLELFASMSDHLKFHWTNTRRK